MSTKAGEDFSTSHPGKQSSAEDQQNCLLQIGTSSSDPYLLQPTRGEGLELRQTRKEGTVSNERPPLGALSLSKAEDLPLSGRQHSSKASFSRVHSPPSSQQDRSPAAITSQRAAQLEEQDAYLMKLLSQGRPAATDLSEARPSKRSKHSGSGGAAPDHATASQAANPGRITGTAAGSTQLTPGHPFSQAMRLVLGEEYYTQMRGTILKHQELFLGQLFELHRITRLQKHLVSVCDRPEAMFAELAKLEAEQITRLQADSDITVEQDDGHENPTSSGAEAQAAPLRGATSAQQHEVNSMHPPSQQQQPTVPQMQQQQQMLHQQQLQQQGQQQQMPFGSMGASMPGQQGGIWPPGMFGRGYPMGYGQPGMGGLGGYAPWGMPPAVGFMGTFSNPYGGNTPFGMQCMDPMMTWYALHYGQYAQAMQNQANANAAAANAQIQAEAQQRVEAAAKEEQGRQEIGSHQQPCTENQRWWQDPEKVFGLAANPAVVANLASNQLLRQRSSRKVDTQTEATSKPATEKRKEDTPRDRSPNSQRERAIKNNCKRRAEGASAGSHPIASAGALQRAGSGLSAFKKLKTKSSNVRRPPTRAESIGSEVSRSAAERSPINEGESSGVAHGAAAKGHPGQATNLVHSTSGQ